MMLPFYKMTGAGNDFVMVDNRDFSLTAVLTHDNIADICNRRFGVGADGLIVAEPPCAAGALRMRLYNAAGEEQPVCGSAVLSFAAFADLLLEGELPQIPFEIGEEVPVGCLNEDDSVSVLCSAPLGERMSILLGGAPTLPEYAGKESPISLELSGGEVLHMAYERQPDGSSGDVTLTGYVLVVFRGELILYSEEEC